MLPITVYFWDLHSTENDFSSVCCFFSSRCLRLHANTSWWSWLIPSCNPYPAHETTAQHKQREHLCTRMLLRFYVCRLHCPTAVASVVWWALTPLPLLDCPDVVLLPEGEVPLPLTLLLLLLSFTTLLPLLLLLLPLTVLYCTVLYCTALSRPVWYLYCIVLSYTVLHCTVLYFEVPWMKGTKWPS